MFPLQFLFLRPWLVCLALGRFLGFVVGLALLRGSDSLLPSSLGAVVHGVYRSEVIVGRAGFWVGFACVVTRGGDWQAADC